MEFLSDLILGFSIALSFENLIYCFIGVFLGTFVGVVPGFGPLGALAILLPFTYSFSNPVTALIFLSGIYYGSQYGGSTTSILLNMPGEIASIVTKIDGYQLTQRGRSGAALTLAALASFIAGSIAILLVAMFSETMSSISFIFGAAEYASLLFLGLVVSASITKNSFLVGFSMVLLGMLFGFVGTDLSTGIERFTFENANLADGFGLAIVIMSFFGLSEIIFQNYSKFNKLHPITSLIPTKSELKASAGPCARGTIIGSIFGLIPGSGSILASFAAYWAEKKVNSEVGKGHIAGVVSPEAANNAAAQTSFIPMLSLGMPITPTQALLMAVLIIHNIVPGPQLLINNQEIFWGLIASMWLGNLFLIILNIPLVGMWVKILRLPKNLLFLFIIIGCVVGAYSFRNNLFDVFLLLPFTALGLLFKYLDWDIIPLAMGFVIGKLFEEHFKRAVLLADGNILTFFDRPFSLTIIIISAIIVLLKLFLYKNQNTKYS